MHLHKWKRHPELDIYNEEGWICEKCGKTSITRICKGIEHAVS